MSDDFNATSVTRLNFKLDIKIGFEGEDRVTTKEGREIGVLGMGKLETTNEHGENEGALNQGKAEANAATGTTGEGCEEIGVHGLGDALIEAIRVKLVGIGPILWVSRESVGRDVQVNAFGNGNA